MPVVVESCRGLATPTATEVCVVNVGDSHGVPSAMLSSFWSLCLSSFARRRASTSLELCDRGIGATILRHRTATGVACVVKRLFVMLSKELRVVPRARVLLSLSWWFCCVRNPW